MFEILRAISFYISLKNKIYKFMLLTYLINWSKNKILNSFLFFYTNIFYYTHNKNHTVKNWINYAKESHRITYNSKIYLVLNILLLYICGLFSIIYQYFFFSVIFFYSYSLNFTNYLYFNFFFFNWNFLIGVKGNFKFPIYKLYNKVVVYNKLKLSKLNKLINLFIYFFFNYFYFFFKSLLIVFLVSFLLTIYLFYFYSLQFAKQLIIWFIIFNIFFWLVSGFNFFIKNYKYGKFTSAIQRFWKRATMCFWVVEGFLFLLFYYYFINSSQEPIYFYDYASSTQDYLLNLTTGYQNLLLISLVIFLLYFLLFNISNWGFSQLIFLLIISSIIIFYIFFVESYQFYYLINQFAECTWVYIEETNSWKLNLDSPRLRVKNYYFSMCLIAKYWHFIFIFLSWVFFLVKSFESTKVSYNLLSFNIQNFIILYALNILTYSQWLKFLTHRFLECTYYWFYLTYNGKLSDYIYNELFIIFYSLINFDFNYTLKLGVGNTIISYKLFLFGDYFNFIY